jgi:outer membrane protein assembly factor BamA
MCWGRAIFLREHDNFMTIFKWDDFTLGQHTTTDLRNIPLVKRMIFRLHAVKIFCALASLCTGMTVFAQEPEPAISESGGATLSDSSIVEAFPILSYDTDAGFGYGGKIVLRNQLGWRESFDLTLFLSTKGERWYRFAFSQPDAELRQGTAYPLAVDFFADYDKWIKNSFFGVGMESSFDAREYYTKEPLEFNLAFSRGFSSAVVGSAGLRFMAVHNYGFADDSKLKTLPPDLNSGRAEFASFFVQIRYDTRNSFINPASGSVVQLQYERAPASSAWNVAFTRYEAVMQYYHPILFPNVTMALRYMTTVINGENLPVQVLLPVGGNRTLRGSPQDRFLDQVAAVANAEVRFPIYKRLSGVTAIDAGRVFHSLSQYSLSRWAVNPTVGLRLVMETFVVRLDVGLGKETTGFYLNFGQIF